MKRRQFLRGALSLGAGGLLPGVALTASDWILPEPAVEPLMPIWDAATGGHWDIVKEWLRLEPSLINFRGGVTVGKDRWEQLTLLHIAATWDSDAKVLQYLVSQFKSVDINAKDGNLATPLHLATIFGAVKVLQYLVSQGADVNAKDKYDGTPLFWAAFYNKDVEGIKFLVSAGANIHVKDHAGRTPLHSAAENTTSVEILQYIISQGVDVNAVSNCYLTPLHFAARKNSNLEIVRYLISVGADVNAKSRSGCPPLYFANTEEKECILREAMAEK